LAHPVADVGGELELALEAAPSLVDGVLHRVRGLVGVQHDLAVDVLGGTLSYFSVCLSSDRMEVTIH